MRDGDVVCRGAGIGLSWTTIIKPDVSLTRQVLTRLERRPVQPSNLQLPTTAPARRLAEMLRDNPGDPRSVEELAACVHVSPRTIERLFREETGTTLRRWRIQVRMEAAAVLLRANSTPSAVAHRVGYTHVNAFRRAFTGHFGLSPTAYAERFAAE